MTPPITVRLVQKPIGACSMIYLVIYLAVSLPVAILVGRCIAHGMGSDEVDRD